MITGCVFVFCKPQGTARFAIHPNVLKGGYENPQTGRLDLATLTTSGKQTHQEEQAGACG